MKIFFLWYLSYRSSQISVYIIFFFIYNMTLNYHLNLELYKASYFYIFYKSLWNGFSLLGYLVYLLLCWSMTYTTEVVLFISSISEKCIRILPLNKDLIYSNHRWGCFSVYENKKIVIEVFFVQISFIICIYMFTLAMRKKELS